MSVSPTAVADEADSAPYDGSFIRPPEQDNSNARIKSPKTSKKDVSIGANPDYPVNTKAAGKKNRKRGRSLFPVQGGCSQRCHEALRVLSDENAELKGKVDEHLKGEERMMGVAEKQKMDLEKQRMELEKQNVNIIQWKEKNRQEIAKKEEYKLRTNKFFNENEDLRKDLAEARRKLDRFTERVLENRQQESFRLSEEVTTVKEDVARLQKELNEKSALLNDAEATLKASEAELFAKTQQLKEMTGMRDEAKKEVEALQEKLEHLRKENGDSVLLGLCRKVDELQKTVEKKELEHEESLQAKIEQLEATLAKKDKEMERKDTSIHQLAKLLDEIKDIQEEKSNERVSPPWVKNDRKRKMDRDLNSKADLSLPDDANRVPRSSTSEARQMPVQSANEERVVKEEVVDQDESDDSAKRSKPVPEAEEIVERYPRRSKRARRA